MSVKKTVILNILDGFGVRKDNENNAINLATTPNLDFIYQHYPHSQLETSGLAVGLPEGQMGNSEVGHMTIGSGRVIYQDLPKISAAIADGSLKNHQIIKESIELLKQNSKKCHIIGLLSDGGVHSHIDHIFALSEIYAKQGIAVNVHAITDGRDVPPRSCLSYIKQFQEEFASNKFVSLASIGGRFYAMDRDNNWSRTELYYNCIMKQNSASYANILEYIKQSYENNIFDEFIKPAVSKDYQGISNGDIVIFANFRADRMRQIAACFAFKDFTQFSRAPSKAFAALISVTEYSDELSKTMQVLFPVEIPKNTLGEIVAKQGLKQLRIAETEKYAHVTFFFNGGVEDKFEGEERILIPSPKVETYDLKPEMSAKQLTEKVIEAVKAQKYDLIVLNYANSDMVGHTGDLSAAIKAIEVLDESIGDIMQAMHQEDIMIITADHGNAEEMYDHKNDMPHTAHTTNPVPFILIGDAYKHSNVKLANGTLADIAPTILKILAINVPEDIQGKSII